MWQVDDQCACTNHCPNASSAFIGVTVPYCLINDVEVLKIIFNISPTNNFSLMKLIKLQNCSCVRYFIFIAMNFSATILEI